MPPLRTTRQGRRRALVLLPLALLGTASLVRSRVPRPQTEDDQWLWQLGESAQVLDVSGDNPITVGQRPFETGFSGGQVLHIRNRRDIRAILRAFQGTRPAPDPTWANDDDARMVVSLAMHGHLVSVDQHRSGSYEVEFDADKSLVTDAQSIGCLMRAIRTASAHARSPHAPPGEYSFTPVVDAAS